MTDDSYLQQLRNSFTHMDEHFFDISGDCFWRWYVPVFISFWNPLSFMILKGHLLSDTQQTISALELLMSTPKGNGHELCDLPCLRFGMLTMRVGNLTLCNSLKFSRDRAVSKLWLCRLHRCHVYCQQPPPPPDPNNPSHVFEGYLLILRRPYQESIGHHDRSELRIFRQHIRRRGDDGLSHTQCVGFRAWHGFSNPHGYGLT